MEQAPVGPARTDRVVGAADDRDPHPLGRAGAQRAERVVDDQRRGAEREPAAQLAVEQREVLGPVRAGHAEDRRLEVRRLDPGLGERRRHRARDGLDRRLRGRGVVDVRARGLPQPADVTLGVRDGGERLGVAAVDAQDPAHPFTAPENIPRMKLRCRNT
jgi:hypothetical protein